MVIQKRILFLQKYLIKSQRTRIQKQTHHIEFDLSGSNLSYEAGDVLGIYPTNDPELIDELITNLNFDPDELIDDKKLKEILLYDFDIRNLTKDFVLAWLDKSSSESLGQIIKNTFRRIHNRA